MVGNGRPLYPWRFRRPNVHALIEQPGVGGDDFPIKRLGKSQGQRCLAIGRWPDNHQQIAFMSHLIVHHYNLRELRPKSA